MASLCRDAGQGGMPSSPGTVLQAQGKAAANTCGGNELCLWEGGRCGQNGVANGKG